MKREEEWDPGQKVDARSHWASKAWRKVTTQTPQACSDQTWIPAPLGSLVEQACKLYSKWLHSKKPGLRVPSTPSGGQRLLQQVCPMEFSEYSPPHFPILLKHSSSNSQTPYKEKQYYVINILYWTLSLIHKTTTFHWQLEGSPYSGQMF